MSFEDRALAALVPTPTNQQNVKTLAKCLKQLVPFVGAGLSANFGYPAWHKLLEEFGRNAEVTTEIAPLLSANQFEEAAEAIVNEVPNQFDDALRDTFDVGKLARPLVSGAVAQLPKIVRGFVITTNFDRVLETAFEDADAPFSKVFAGTRIREATRAVQLNERCLIKLHGDYEDSQSQILTLSQYRREYGDDDPAKANPDLKLPSILAQALGSRPLLFVGCSLKTDRTTRVINALAQRLPGVMHFALLSSSESTRERRKQLDQWRIRPLFFPDGEFGKVDEFLRAVAEQQEDAWTIGSASRTSTNQRGRTLTDVHINGYKLYYFRRTRKLSTAMLAASAGIPESVVTKLETVSEKGPLGLGWFQRCSLTVVSQLESVLECPGRLAAGQQDDFLTQYMLFYREYHGRREGNAPEGAASTDELSLFETRAVVFDFDGTLTILDSASTTWEAIWLKLGYSIEDCARLHAQYSQGVITHQQWCDLTRDEFRKAGLTHEMLKEIAESITLIAGTTETLDTLRRRNVRLYLVSGSIKQVIAHVLGTHWDWFEELHANDMVFDATGLVSAIRSTRYDFEGKAEFIKKVIAEQDLSPTDVLFVGNSCNDIFASRSGARTLCVNARATDQFNKQHWTYFIPRMDDLQQILKYASL